MVAKLSHNARERSSQRRLQEISHHFLSDDQPHISPDIAYPDTASNKVPDSIPAQDKQPYVLPILMGLQQENYFSVYALSQALLAHKKSSAVLLVEGELSAANYSTVFTSHEHQTAQQATNQTSVQHLLQHTGYQHTPDVYLIPIASIASPYVKSAQRLIIPVQATLDGIRAAYLQLKRLAELKEDIAIGIIMLKSSDPAWARRCFDKLATAAQSFLELRITSFGYLPDMTYPELLPPLANTQTLPHEMMDVADMLLHDMEQNHLQNTEESATQAVDNSSAAGIPWA